MDIKQTLRFGKIFLGKRKIFLPEMDALILLSFVLKKPKEYIFTYPQKKISLMNLICFFYCLLRRTHNVPIAYIVGKKEFYKLDFQINKNVLVPRPETEILIEESLKTINAFQNPVTVADIGTGSGCIAVTLCKNTDKIKKCVATDISPKAIKIAKKNACTHNVEHNIEFLTGNLIEPLSNLDIDIIISNPPYLSLDEYESNRELSKEPKIAFVYKKMAETAYNTICFQIKKYKLKPKYLLLEIGFDMALCVSAIIKKHFPKTQITVKKDLSGNDRVLSVKFQ